MPSNVRFHLRSNTAITLALVILSGVLAAQVWAQNSASIPGDSWVRISAFTNQPLDGADVAVFSRDGQLLFEQLNATNARGIYPAKIANLPRDFRVVVAWDRNRQPTLSSLHSLGLVVLSADVRNYNPVNDVVYVNPVTTMVTGVLLRHPQFSLEQAQARYDISWTCPPTPAWARQCGKINSSTPRIFPSRRF